MKLNKVLLLLFCLTCYLGSFAESPTVRLGDSYFKQFDFQNAVKCYLKAARKDTTTYLKQQLADSYRLMNDPSNAEVWYQKLADDQAAAPINKIYYAEALRSNQKYAEAKVYYKNYLTAVPTDLSVKERMAGLDKVDQLSKDKGMYTIDLLTINSPKSDFGPAFYKDGKIIFCSNRGKNSFTVRKDNWTDGTFLQEYVGTPDGNGNITSVDLLTKSKPNGKYHQGPVSYSELMQELYLTRSNYTKSRASFSGDKAVKLKIYRTGYLPSENKWNPDLQDGVPFNNKEYSVAHPSLTKDGKTLYFASDMPGGYGGTDLYVCTRESTGAPWGNPINLGPTINTIGEEKFPFIANDGTLYFASDGHTGLGGLDVYSVNKDGKKGWGTPENLGYPINTNKDDFGFIIDGENKQGYFASNRPGGPGDDDIYHFTRKGILICGVVYDAKTSNPIEGAKVVMMELKEDKGNKITKKEGDFCFPATPKKTYKFIATKEGFLPGEVTTETKDVPVNIRIPLIKEGGINLEVTVLNKKSREPIDMANVKLINMSTNKDATQQTNKDGKSFFVLDPNTNYRIEGSKDLGDPETKYLTVSTTTTTVGKQAPTTIYATIELEKVKKGVAIKIENIYYDLDKWFIRPDAAKELDKLVKVLLDNPTMEIELSSHTDCRATAKYNMNLSAKRAEAAVNYIATKGVNGSRMVAAGYGESRLVNKCECEGTVIVPCTDEQHQENRRTEFKILKF